MQVVSRIDLLLKQSAVLITAVEARAALSALVIEFPNFRDTLIRTLRVNYTKLTYC